MITLIESHRPEVAALCGRFGVRSLEVFGSAASGTFDAAHSDVDFLVDFNEDDAGSLFHTATSGCRKRLSNCLGARWIWCRQAP